MAVVKPVILQIVGYQNSGKTTFTAKLIERLTNLGIKTTAIKHHGHGGKPDVPEGKDSSRYVMSGAAAAIVEGGGRLVLQAEHEKFSLEDQIQLLAFFHPDVILIEGHKSANYPKLVMVKEMADTILLNKLDNLEAVLYWQEDIKRYIETNMNIPCFSIDDESVVNFIVQLCTK
ncbi:molybdopterin-guanine dinucleotide biosynthesis protein B [Neobacillus mesonae]|uniref:Molybdopterin-guanine dinucleotide biosynthesis protein B n=1 Tax=Neobacillus mesonae TaxID=1193713 RepID=A0A3T0HW76_9BACI|nr:molybdopterin-guanine dinucleotide biosynthesis protein B [Neobacillus mesonae]AZU61237.1 molybdopterin-guanine dinucleotide biosynthesis protein B [Neobacillus mesonae]MED4206119.1 molybdopterin-guanine dinucleotide biosynthesis protein B [Neobacillus mesonae]